MCATLMNALHCSEDSREGWVSQQCVKLVYSRYLAVRREGVI